MKSISYALVGLLLITAFASCSKSDGDRNTPTPDNYKLRLMGVVKACNGSNATYANVIIRTNLAHVAIHVTNGAFDTTVEFNMPYEWVNMWAIDLNTLTVSDTVKLRVSGDKIDFGQVSACARNVDEFIKCKIDNENYVYVPAYLDTLRVGGWDTMSAPTTYIYREGMPLITSRFFRMQFAGMTAGTFGVNWNSTLHIGRYYSFNLPATGRITYTSYGNVGELIKGTINVPFVDNTDSLTHLLTGTFQVRRDY